MLQDHQASISQYHDKLLQQQNKIAEQQIIISNLQATVLVSTFSQPRESKPQENGPFSKLPARVPQLDNVIEPSNKTLMACRPSIHFDPAVAYSHFSISKRTVISRQTIVYDDISINKDGLRGILSC